MSVTISGPFSGHGNVAVPVPYEGGPRVRETRVTISEDQATRLRAMMDALHDRRPAPPAHAARAAPPPAPPAPPVRTARVVTIASGKGGVGKTTASVNLAI